MAVKVSGEQSEGAYTLIEMTHPPDAGPALRFHPKPAEAYYVPEGEYSTRYGEKEILAKAEDFVFIPRGFRTTIDPARGEARCWSYPRRALKSTLHKWQVW